MPSQNAWGLRPNNASRDVWGINVLIDTNCHRTVRRKMGLTEVVWDLRVVLGQKLAQIVHHHLRTIARDPMACQCVCGQ